MRAFARQIGLSPSATSEILSGRTSKKWKISPKRAAEILDHLSIADVKKRRMLLLMEQIEKFEETEWKSSDYDILTDWIYCTVLIAFDLHPQTEASVGQLSRRLGVSEEKINAAIETLARKGLLKKNEEGRFEKNPENWATLDNVPNEIIRESHLQNLNLARLAVHLPVEERDLNILTFAGSKKNTELLRKEVRKFLNRVQAIMETDDQNDEIYRFSIQFFPINSKLWGQ